MTSPPVGIIGSIGFCALTLSACVGSPTPGAKAPIASTAPNSAILAPASVPSAVGVCSEKVSLGAAGGVGPLLCGDPGPFYSGAPVPGSHPVNARAWAYLLPGNGGLFSLGRAVQQSVVQSLVCVNPEGSDAMTESAFYIANAYYGWGLPNLGDALYNGGC